MGGDVPSSASEAAGDSAVELTATVAFTRRGAETKLVLPGLAPQKHSSRCDPALIEAIARGRAWFEELVSGRARSLQELAKRDGISRRYIRRLIGLAFLSPELIEAILQGRQPVALTATRLTELDLPLDWTEQQKLLQAKPQLRTDMPQAAQGIVTREGGNAISDRQGRGTGRRSELST